MMLYPAMSLLNKYVENRYLLVNVVARRARQIAEQADEEGYPSAKSRSPRPSTRSLPVSSPQKTSTRTSQSKS